MTKTTKNASYSGPITVEGALERIRANQPSVCGVEETTTSIEGEPWTIRCVSPLPCSLHPQQVKGVCTEKHWANADGSNLHHADHTPCQPPATGEGVIREFVEDTPDWYRSFRDAVPMDRPCVMCGIVPDKLKELADALQELTPKGNAL